MDKEQAIKATNAGAVAACVSGVMTLAISLFALFNNSAGGLGFWNDPAILVDVILIFICAYGIYRKSRFAAVFMVIYFLVSKIVIGIETGQTSGIGMGLVFLYFFGNAARGAFVFHRIEKAENPNYQPTSKLAYWIGVPLAAIFVALMGFGVMTMTGLAPPTDVQPGSSLLPTYHAELVSNDIIYADDEIVYFYSYGLSSILEGGSVLTDDRVIMYFTNQDGELEIYELYLFDISSVELVSSGNMFNDSIYKVNSFEPDAWLQISLPTEKRGDVLFVEELRSRIQP